MRKIKMKDCRFEINEEKRTIVCWIDDTSKIAEDFIREQNLDPGQMFWQSNSNRKMWHLMEIPDKVYGKAVCAAEDTWDEEFGKVVAYHK